MPRHRTTARAILALTCAAFAAALLVASASGAREAAPIIFPLIGDITVDDNYGDPRANGSHAGIDMEAPRRTPVVAAEAGKVKWWTTSWRAGCMLYLYGASGTTYLYIHLNNDRTLSNDNDAGCKAPATYATKDGARVTAGQLIAWSGDSGDADGNPHLHFEVHPNDGADVNPYRYLVEATRTLFPARLGTTFTVGVRGTPVAAGSGRVTLRATAVRWWPGGRWTPLGTRDLELGTSTATLVDSELATALTTLASRPLPLKQGVVYSAFTAPAKVTAAALRGAPAALIAARITRPGATLVALDPAAETPTEPVVDDGDWTPPWEQDDDETSPTTPRPGRP